MLTFSEIYTKLSLPPNLQEHHCRVASVGLAIADHWKGNPLQRKTLAQALMAHDLGNIIKFDLEKFPELLKDNGEGVEYWKGVQRKIISRYGNNVHEATIAMAKEMGAQPSVIFLLEKMGSSQVMHTFEHGTWEDKILLYADMRVMPQGIVTLAERFADLAIRYSHKISHEEALKRQAHAEFIEQDIQKYCSIELTAIDNPVVGHYQTELSQMTF